MTPEEVKSLHSFSLRRPFSQRLLYLQASPLQLSSIMPSNTMELLRVIHSSLRRVYANTGPEGLMCHERLGGAALHSF